MVLRPSEEVTSAVLHGSVVITGPDKCFQRMKELLLTIVLVFYRDEPALLSTRAGFGPLQWAPGPHPPTRTNRRLWRRAGGRMRSRGRTLSWPLSGRRCVGMLLLSTFRLVFE